MAQSGPDAKTGSVQASCKLSSWYTSWTPRLQNAVNTEISALALNSYTVGGQGTFQRKVVKDLYGWLSDICLSDFLKWGRGGGQCRGLGGVGGCKNGLGPGILMMLCHCKLGFNVVQLGVGS